MSKTTKHVPKKQQGKKDLSTMADAQLTKLAEMAAGKVNKAISRFTKPVEQPEPKNEDDYVSDVFDNPAHEAVHNYLQLANKHTRHEHTLHWAVDGYFNYNHEDNLGSYSQVSSQVLKLLADEPSIAETFRKELGGYKYGKFTTMLNQTVLFCNLITSNRANVAMIDLSKFEGNINSDFIKLETIRYKSELAALEVELAYWSQHDSKQ